MGLSFGAEIVSGVKAKDENWGKLALFIGGVPTLVVFNISAERTQH